MYLQATSCLLFTQLLQFLCMYESVIVNMLISFNIYVRLYLYRIFLQFTQLYNCQLQLFTLITGVVLSICPLHVRPGSQLSNCTIVYDIRSLLSLPSSPLSITEVQSLAFLFYPKFSVFTYFLLFSCNLFSPLFSIFLYVKPSKLSTVMLCLLHAYSWPSSLPPLCYIRPLHHHTSKVKRSLKECQRNQQETQKFQ